MHPRTTELLSYIDAQTSQLRAAFDDVHPERRATRPAPNRWSPAEVVHHVVIVERLIARPLRVLIEQARGIGLDPDESSILAVIQPQRAESRVRRVVTAPTTEPRDTNIATLWNEFAETRRTLTGVIISGDGLALGDVSAPHPALGPLTGYGWIAFVGSHAARHAAQIREDQLS
jgi:hypothetical protein